MEHLWVDINGRYLKLLDSSTGFKKSTDSDTKQWLTSKPSITMIVAETGLGSTLNIKTTGYLTSPLDDCFGKFNTQDFDQIFKFGRADSTYMLQHKGCRDRGAGSRHLELS